MQRRRLVSPGSKDSVEGRDEAGSFRVLYGSAGGLTVAGAKAWTQDSPGIPERAEPRDYFGFEVYSSDFDGDGVADVPPRRRTNG